MLSKISMLGFDFGPAFFQRRGLKVRSPFRMAESDAEKLSKRKKIRREEVKREEMKFR